MQILSLILVSDSHPVTQLTRPLRRLVLSGAVENSAMHAFGEINLSRAQADAQSPQFCDGVTCLPFFCVAALSLPIVLAHEKLSLGTGCA